MQEFGWLDITSYISMSISTLTLFSVISTLAGVITGALIIDCLKLKAGYKQILAVVIPTISILVISWTLILIPSHKKILAVKLDKITNEAVNKENINAGVDKIKDIVLKLEKKYLGE